MKCKSLPEGVTGPQIVFLQLWLLVSTVPPYVAQMNGQRHQAAAWQVNGHKLLVGMRRLHGMQDIYRCYWVPLRNMLHTCSILYLCYC
jgi:hypothetical protein